MLQVQALKLELSAAQNRAADVNKAKKAIQAELERAREEANAASVPAPPVEESSEGLKAELAAVRAEAAHLDSANAQYKLQARFMLRCSP